MRRSLFYSLVLLVALAGCSVTSGAQAPSAPGGPATPTPVVSTSTDGGSTTTGQVSFSSDPTTAAIQSVIQKANQEQQDAFAKQDPTLMQDTSTSAYYDQMTQTNSSMTSNGVTSIKLLNLQWGSITVTSSTTAQATTHETWSTTFSDSSTQVSTDQNVYTLVLEQGLWKIQSDDQPSSNAGQGSGPSTPSPSSPVAPSVPSTPAPSAPSGQLVPVDQTDVSHNWSGYAATGGKYTAVAGTWSVPRAQATGSVGSGATWVGIGGVQSHDLIQAGTQEVTDGSGTVQYQAWIETLPRPSQQVPFVVGPGDSVTVSIDQQSSGQWLIAFKNDTTGQSYQTTVQYDSSLSSAEWVEEAPSVRRGVLPLDSFGSVQFSAGSAIKDGKTVTIDQAGAKPISMADSSGSIIATPSILTADGGGFSVSRTDAQTQPAPVPFRSRGRGATA